jgi:hypothetical protein
MNENTQGTAHRQTKKKCIVVKLKKKTETKYHTNMNEPVVKKYFM